MKKLLIAMTSIFILLVASTRFFVLAYLTDQDVTEEPLLIGDVEVDYDIYFDKDGILYPATEVVIDENLNITKPGVYSINVTDAQSINFIEHLRIRFFVSSNVDTYIRIQLIDYLSLTLENFEGVITEIPIVGQETAFNHVSTWYDYQATDGYYYLMNPVKQVSVTTPLTVDFINAYFPGVNYSARPIGYALQLGIKIEAVQAVRGPQMRWGLANPPWGGNW